MGNGDFRGRDGRRPPQGGPRSAAALFAALSPGQSGFTLLLAGRRVLRFFVPRRRQRGGAGEPLTRGKGPTVQPLRGASEDWRAATALGA